MDKDDEHPPAPTAEELKAQIERGLADAAAGRTTPVSAVLAMLDASIARMEAARGDAA